MLRLLDGAFVVVHTALIVFNVIGWAVPSWRRANLIVLGLTGASWFGLGIFYGWGFCPLTEWHFRVLERLGERDLPPSYIRYLIERLLGLDLPSNLVDTAVLTGYLAALAVSIVLNVRDHRAGRRVVRER